MLKRHTLQHEGQPTKFMNLTIRVDKGDEVKVHIVGIWLFSHPNKKGKKWFSIKQLSRNIVFMVCLCMCFLHDIVPLQQLHHELPGLPAKQIRVFLFF